MILSEKLVTHQAPLRLGVSEEVSEDAPEVVDRLDGLEKECKAVIFCRNAFIHFFYSVLNHNPFFFAFIRLHV